MAYINYYQYIASEPYKEIKKEVKRIHNHKCVVCAGTYKLQVHHKDLKYRVLGREATSDLTLLCDPCHEGKHYYDKVKSELSLLKEIQTIETEGVKAFINGDIEAYSMNLEKYNAITPRASTFLDKYNLKFD